MHRLLPPKLQSHLHSFDGSLNSLNGFFGAVLETFRENNNLRSKYWAPSQNSEEYEEKNSEALINSTDDLMWSVDKNFRLIVANTAFINTMKTCTGEEIHNGDNLLDPNIHSEEKLRKWKLRYEMGLAGESFTVEDYAPVTKIWRETLLHPMYEGKEIIGVSCFSRDITEKKRATEVIRKSEQLMAEAQSIANFGSWECSFDDNGNVLPNSMKWSDHLYEIFGFENKEIEITPDVFYNMIYQNDLDTVKKSMKEAFINQSCYVSEYRIVKANGEVRWLRSKGRFTLGEDKLLKIVGTAQDITEKKIAEQEKTRLIDELIKKNTHLEQFAYMISHNLRAPVAQILGLVDIFSNETNKEVKKKCTEGLNLATRRLDEVIMDLNGILHVKNEIIEQHTRVNLKDVINEVQNALEKCFAESKGAVKVDFKTAEIFSVKRYVYSVFYNLILNSLKYRRAGVSPLITVTSEVCNQQLIIKFRDNGMGIDVKAYGDKVFKLYNRFHSHIEGRGVGLYMVKTQVESLGGRISLTSEVNVGTEFIITLPFDSKY